MAYFSIFLHFLSLKLKIGSFFPSHSLIKSTQFELHVTWYCVCSKILAIHNITEGTIRVFESIDRNIDDQIIGQEMADSSPDPAVDNIFDENFNNESNKC